MAGERTIDKGEYPDQLCTWTFGPLAEADTGSDVYTRLPFLNDKDVVIDSVIMESTVAGAAGNIALAKGTVGATPIGALSAANKVTELQATSALTALTPINHPVHPSTGNTLNNNVIVSGQSLYLYSTAAATNLAGLLITIRGRERRL